MIKLKHPERYQGNWIARMVARSARWKALRAEDDEKNRTRRKELTP